jgi:predicted transposase/invertase (TIGR01784 family)
LPTRRFHTCFHLREDEERDIMLTEALEIHFLNMVKYRRQAKKGLSEDPLNPWMAWLNQKSPPELLAEVAKMDAAIQAANERMVYVTGDKEAIRAYERRQMALSDYNSEINYAREEGMANGMKKGRAEGMAEVAQKMKAMGFSNKQIQSITNSNNRRRTNTMSNDERKEKEGSS